MGTSHRVIHIFVLLSLCGLLMLWGLGSIGLTDRDEGRNAEAGREMLETGDWITPTFNYEPRFYKPVLIYWLMSGSYYLFGVDEFAARFPSALFGAGLILLQYWFLARWRDPHAGLLSALMLLLNLEILGLSRMALTDSVLVFFTTSAHLAYWVGLHGEGRNRYWLWWFYAGMGLATLTKGPVGFIVPLVTMSLYLSATKRWGQYWRDGHPLLGAALFALVTVPWYATMLSLHGSTYVTIAKSQTVGRFMAPMEGHGFGFLFYVPVLLLGFFPWSGLLPMALYHCFTRWRAARTTADASGPALPAARRLPAEYELELFAALWVAGAFLFFTLSSTRLQHYIAPLFPGAALLTAMYWYRGLHEPQTKGIRASIHTMMAIGYGLAVGFASLPSLYPKIAGKLTKEFPLATTIDLGSGPYVISGVLLIGMALVGYFGLNESRRAGAFWAAGGSLALVVLAVIQLVFPGLNRYFITPPQALAYAAGVNLGQNDRLIVYGSTRPSTIFYAKRKALFVPDGEEEKIGRALSQPGQTMILLPESFESRLPPEAKQLVPILKQHGYLLLANRPMVSIPESATPPPVKFIPGH